MKADQSSENEENFIGVLTLQEKVFNVPHEDVLSFDSEERIANLLFEHFILYLKNEMNETKMSQKQDLLIITYDFLRLCDGESQDLIKSVLINKNLLDKKYVFIPLIKENGEWYLIYIENMYSNFSQEVVNKTFSGGNIDKNVFKEKTKLRIYYFNKKTDEEKLLQNLKALKNAVINKLEKFYVYLIGVKYNIKYEKCFKSPQNLSFDYSNSKLLDNLSDFNNGVVMVKIVNDILKSELTVEDFLKSYDLSKTDYYPSISLVKKELKHILGRKTENKPQNLFKISQEEERIKRQSSEIENQSISLKPNHEERKTSGRLSARSPEIVTYKRITANPREENGRYTHTQTHTQAYTHKYNSVNNITYGNRLTSTNLNNNSAIYEPAMDKLNISKITKNSSEGEESEHPISNHGSNNHVGYSVRTLNSNEENIKRFTRPSVYRNPNNNPFKKLDLIIPEEQQETYRKTFIGSRPNVFYKNLGVSEDKSGTHNFTHNSTSNVNEVEVIEITRTQKREGDNFDVGRSVKLRPNKFEICGESAYGVSKVKNFSKSPTSSVKTVNWDLLDKTYKKISLKSVNSATSLDNSVYQSSTFREQSESDLLKKKLEFKVKAEDGINTNTTNKTNTNNTTAPTVENDGHSRDLPESRATYNQGAQFVNLDTQVHYINTTKEEEATGKFLSKGGQLQRAELNPEEDLPFTSPQPQKPNKNSKSSHNAKKLKLKSERSVKATNVDEVIYENTFESQNAENKPKNLKSRAKIKNKTSFDNDLTNDAYYSTREDQSNINIRLKAGKVGKKGFDSGNASGVEEGVYPSNRSYNINSYKTGKSNAALSMLSISKADEFTADGINRNHPNYINEPDEQRDVCCSKCIIY